MKTLYRFIIKSYIGPLVMTFFIVMFILLMQFLWKYIDDLVGKGLEWKVIAELLLYASSNLVPMALPLSTLLASLMTMGNLGENNELLAMKSAGISLPRILSPLIFITILISISAFFFSNNVLPYTNLKISTLLYSVKQQKPELAIKEGIFTTINDVYSIKIAEKNQKTSLMRRIMIYDHSKNEGNLVITSADSGYIKVSNDEKRLVATLYSGNTYEERIESATSKSGNRSFPSTSQKFQEQVIVFELQGKGLQKTDEELFKSSAQTMNLHQLDIVKDSLSKQYRSREKSFQHNLHYSVFQRNKNTNSKDSLHKKMFLFPDDSLFNILSNLEKQRIIDVAISSARSTKSFISSTSDEFYSKGKYIARHKIEWNRKFSLSFACFVFFFIGAPLGAIIRKGGLGMPVVISVFFFVLYYIITISGEKFARELIWQPAAGMWLSSFILLPLGAFLSYKATTDSVIMNPDFYTESFKKILLLYKKIHRKIIGLKPTLPK
ncbi:MAG: YjgP/YjgQ family permease [Bacteroidales bacterium]|nr:YjgP/YjgQ family permease [Bacteroidales bacterium]